MCYCNQFTFTVVGNKFTISDMHEQTAFAKNTSNIHRTVKKLLSEKCNAQDKMQLLSRDAS